MIFLIIHPRIHVSLQIEVLFVYLVDYKLAFHIVHTFANSHMENLILWFSFSSEKQHVGECGKA